MGERRPWRSLEADLFKFATTDLRDLHVAVMTAFEQAAVLAPALNVDQVRSALRAVGWDEPVPDEVVNQTLASLTGWGLLEATQDHAARYATPEEFERRNLQWSLTPKGEAAIAGVLHAMESLRGAVGLQAAVIDGVADSLSDLAALLDQPRAAATDARIHVQLAQIENHLNSLVVSVRQFSGHLQRLLRDDGTDYDVFLEVKRRTVNYLEEYVEGVERPHRRVAVALARIESQGVASLFDRALAGANLAPVSTGDPGPEWLAMRERRWLALRAWFWPADPAAAPLLGGLLEVARTAIIELLRVLERRWDSRRRSTSVSNDFRALARLFAAAPGDDDAHRLFSAAFGMWPARHAHLRSVDGEERCPNSRWVDTEPTEVAPALRTSGTLAHKGRSNPVADPSRVRAARQRAQAAALAAHDHLRAALTTEGAVPLSRFSHLPSEAFGELLDLLATALEAPLSAAGTREALSIDGRVEVTLRDARDGRTAILTTDHGALTGPDLLVSIHLTDAEGNAGTVEPLEEAIGG